MQMFKSDILLQLEVNKFAFHKGIFLFPLLLRLPCTGTSVLYSHPVMCFK